MTLGARTLVLIVLLIAAAVCAEAQQPPPREDTRQSMLGEATLGLLPTSVAVPEARARGSCLDLPVAPPNDRLQGPHGDSVISARCEVVEYRVVTAPSPPRWAVARYRWTSIFTAEDAARGPDARDTVTEEEVVLFDASPGPAVRPVWHARFETGPYAIWRSVTPEVAPTRDGTTLLSVMSCLNGTGGCGQEFLHRHADGRWFPVRQPWLDQLPPGFVGRILHGVRIDPASLRGDAGFYGAADPNCCPSERLLVDLALQRDALVLQRHTVVREPN
jgi:hypothetical protein